MPKKKFLVSLAKPDAKIGGMDVYGKKRKFSKSGKSFVLSDAGEAKELDKHFGNKGSRDIIVSEIPNYKEESGHTYSFSVKKEDDETPEEKRERMREEGWVEYSPGKWKRIGTE